MMSHTKGKQFCQPRFLAHLPHMGND